MRINSEIISRNRRHSVMWSLAITFILALFGLPVFKPWWLAIVIATGIGLLTYRGLTQRVRRRVEVLREPFPAHWGILLQQHVAYYNGLSEQDQHEFRRLIQVFLAETPITGIETEVEDLDRILVAASAIIPILGFPDWEYSHVSEVLLYPGRFNQGFSTEQNAQDRNILGMVSGRMADGIVILSQPALRSGFANASDKRNVGLHEFVHMVDKADGSIDGLAYGLPADMLRPWYDFIQKKLDHEGAHWGDINPYGATNAQEFLAVTSEYFFENPQAMARKHPELYRYLCKLYRQTPIEILQEGLEHQQVVRVSRNSPCPCGSGKKHKRCCLDKLR